MKHMLTTLLIASSITCFSQPLQIKPSRNAAERKWMRSEQYEMEWYMLNNGNKNMLGTVTTNVTIQKNQLYLVTNVALKQMPDKWIDTSIANANTLAPVYHASYNNQRDMALHFNDNVTGYYHDKTKSQYNIVNETSAVSFFDSNLYPYLLRFLSFKENYTAAIPIFDYNPNGVMGVVHAYITNVTTSTIEHKQLGRRTVWAVTVTDELNDSNTSSSIYYIDQQDRTLWKQEITAGKRKMLMTRKEVL
ncbi:MAG: hypothetical protein ACK4HE_01205 [Chitinophagaceae bacterium]